jgi:hypothetical protein
MQSAWGKIGNTCTILVGNPERRRPLRRPRRRWENNIKMDLTEKGFGYVDWIKAYMIQNRDL